MDLFLCNIYCTFFKKGCMHIWTLDMHISSLVFYPMSYKVRQIICPLGNLTIHWNLHFVYFFLWYEKICVRLCGGSFKVAFSFDRNICILYVHATLLVIIVEEFFFIAEKRSASMNFFYVWHLIFTLLNIIDYQ